MRSIFIFGLTLLSLLAVGQNRRLTDEQINKSGMNKLVFVDNSEAADSLAKFDIKNGTPFLLLQSGIAPVQYPADKTFEKKYKVFYYDNGCTGPKEELAATYNKVTFDYLTKKYGTKWTREIRKDVIGFTEWK